MSGCTQALPLLGERPIALENDILRRRIYAPQAYRLVRDMAVVPVVHNEAYRLSTRFPLVWRSRGTTFDFVAVRSLIDDQRCQPAGAQGALPLILHAYPFVLDPAAAPGPGSLKMIDDVFADKPTDVGASITTTTGQFSRATVMRLQILDDIGPELSRTRDVSGALAKCGLLQPWKLQFDVEGRSIGIPDLFVVDAVAFNTGSLSEIIESQGAHAAWILGLHRISLFRAGPLLAAARRFLKSTAASPTDDTACSAA
jgi:hypothetical protein